MAKLNFIDAQAMSEAHPDTFEAPSCGVLACISIGDSVKVSTGIERFWVDVTGIQGDKITGIVNNDLICTDEHGLSCGDEVTFEMRHVYQVLGE